MFCPWVSHWPGRVFHRPFSSIPSCSGLPSNAMGPLGTSLTSLQKNSQQLLRAIVHPGHVPGDTIT